MVKTILSMRLKASTVCPSGDFERWNFEMISVSYCNFAFRWRSKVLMFSSAYFVQSLLHFSYNPCFPVGFSGLLIELDLFIDILVPAWYTLLLMLVSCLKMQLFSEIACLAGRYGRFCFDYIDIVMLLWWGSVLCEDFWPSLPALCWLIDVKFSCQVVS